MKFTSPNDEIFESLYFFREPGLRQNIIEKGKILKVKKGGNLIKEGQYLNELPIVIKGSIRVFQQYEDKQILLYYVEPENTCIMSISSCIFSTPSPSAAITEEDTEILIIPSLYISQWQKQFTSWNEFILSNYKNRYDELLDSFEKLAFNNIDKRIMEYLKNYTDTHNTKVIPFSHQKLANELGTNRVVISRILKSLEVNNLLELRRGEIVLKK